MNNETIKFAISQLNKALNFSNPFNNMIINSPDTHYILNEELTEELLPVMIKHLKSKIAVYCTDCIYCLELNDTIPFTFLCTKNPTHEKNSYNGETYVNYIDCQSKNNDFDCSDFEQR